MNDRRANQPVRQQAQQWFDALRAHLTNEAAQNDVAERLKHWATLDDMLGDCPQLLPPLLTMAWQLRHQPAFTELFQTAGGVLAEDTKTALKPCGKSFDQVVLAHLQGAMRVVCVREETVWLAHEKTRTKPNPLTKLPLIGGLIKRLLRQRDEDLIRNYPQHGLYQALKPWLRYPHQFALVEALATLPTSTVMILGDATRGLTSDPAIRNLAALESRKCKFVTGLARVFTDTIIKAAEEARVAGRPFKLEPEPVPSNAAEITGMALCHLTVDGLHLSKGAVGVRENARDIVIKMSLAMGYDMWRVFATQESAMNVAQCPAALARALGGNAVNVHHRTSEALNALPNPQLIEGVVAGLYAGAGPDALARWAASPACASGWNRIATEIKQVLKQGGPDAVTPEGASAFAQSLVPSFAALSGDAPPQGVDQAEPASGTSAAPVEAVAPAPS